MVTSNAGKVMRSCVIFASRFSSGAALDDAPDHREHATDALFLIVRANRRLRIAATEQQQRGQRMNSRERGLSAFLGAAVDLLRV